MLASYPDHAQKLLSFFTAVTDDADETDGTADPGDAKAQQRRVSPTEALGWFELPAACLR